MEKTQLKILLIEDSPTDALLLRESLEKDSLTAFVLTTADRLSTAADLLEKSAFDLILLDLGLPDSQGLESFTRARQSAPQTPIIILSGLNDEVFATQAVLAGAQDYLMKDAYSFASCARAIRYAIERQRNQQQVCESEARLKGFLDSAPDAMIIVNQAGQIILVNIQAEKLFGYKQEELLQQDLQLLIPERFQAEHEGHRADYFKTPRSREMGNGLELYARQRDGSEIPVEITLSHHQLNDEVAVLCAIRDITERKRTENALRESEIRFATLFRSNPVPVGITRASDYRIVDVNDAWCSLTGFSREEAIGHTSTELGLAKPHTLQQVRDMLQTQRDIHQHEILLFTRSGQERLMLINSETIELGGETYLLNNLLDITERKQAEQKLRESETLLRQVLESTQDSIFAVDRDYRLLVNNERHQKVLIETGIHPLRIGDSILPPDYLPEVLNHWRGLYDRAFNGEEFKWETEWPYKDGQQHVIESNFSPLHDADGEITGVLVVIHDITERKQSEKLLRQWADAFENCAHGIAIGLPTTNKILTCNPAFAQLQGRTIEEISSMPILSMYAPEDHEHVRQNIVEADRKGSQRYEAHMLRQDGTRYPVQMDVVSVRDATGNILYRVATQQDITKRKQAEKQLRESETLLRQVLESIPDSTFALDRDYRFLIGNQHHQQELVASGGHPLQVGELVLSPAYPTEVLDFWRTAYERAFTGETFSLESSWVDDKGQSHVHDNMLSPLRNATSAIIGAIIGVLVIAHDITERKQAENALAQTRNTLAQAQKIAHMGSFEYIAATQTTVWSEEEYSIYGLDPANPSPAYEEMLRRLIHPDDAALLNEVFTNAMQNGLVYELEHRIVRPDGSVRWVYDRAHPYFDAQGTLERYIGTTLDITERKQAELEITMLARFPGENPNPVLRISQEGVILNANQASTPILKVWGSQVGEKAPETWVQIMSQALQTRQAQVMEIVCDDRLFSAQITPIPGEDYVNIYGNDITERKRAEAALAISEQRLTNMVRHAMDAIVAADADLRVVIYNTAAEKMFGIPAAEALGQPLTRFIPDQYHGAHRKYMTGLTHEKMQGIPPSKVFSIEGKRANGEVFPAESSISYVEQGGEKLYTAIIRDITERKQSETLLQQRMEDLTFINRLNDAVNHGEGIDQITELLALEANKIFGSQSTSIYLLKPDKKRLFLQHYTMPRETVGRLEKLMGRPVPQIDLPVGGTDHFSRVLASENGFLITGFKDISAWLADFSNTSFLPVKVRPLIRKIIPAAVKLLNINSVVSIPLKAGGKLLGLIEFVADGEFAEGTLERLQNVRHQLAEVILRKQMEQALRESEEKYRGLAESSDAIIVLLDADGRFQYLNEKAAQFQGVQVAETLGKTMHEILPKALADLNLERVQKVISTGQGMVVESPIGDGIYFRTSVQPIHDEQGKTVMALMSATDITELKTAQKKLVELNASLEERVKQRTAEVQDLYDNAPTGYHSLDAAGKIIMINQTELNWLGYTRAELLGQPFARLFTPASLATFQSNFAAFKQRGWVRDLEFDLIRKDGSTFPVLVSATAINDESGNYLISRSTVFDNTERKNAEEALKASEAKYRHLFENMTEGFSLNEVITNEDGRPVDFRFLDANAAYGKHTGLQPGDAIGKTMLEINPQADLRQIENYGKVALTGEPLAYEYFSKTFNCHFSVRAFSPKPGQFAAMFEDITERKQAEEALLASEAQNRSLFEESPDAAALLSADGTFIKVNHAYEELIGIKQAELVGTTGEQFNMVTPETRAYLYQLVIEAQAKGEPYAEAEYTIQCVNGQTRDVETRIFVMTLQNQPHVLYTVRDVTARKKAEQALRESRERLQYFFDTASDLIQSMDEDGRYRYVNSAWCKTLGYSAAEALQLSMFDVIDASHHDHCRAMLDLLVTHQQPQQLEVIFKTKSGEAVIVEGSVSSRKDGNGHIATNGIFRNITERRKSEEALRESYDQLSVANIALEKAMRVKDEFLASMSHELRTPLTGILGLSEALQLDTYGALNDRQKKSLTIIRESGNHLLTLINDILDLSKIEAGKLEIQTSTCSLADICQTGLQLTKGMAHEKRQHVNYSAPIDPILLEVDARRVKQIIVNLLSNAIKFTPANGELGLTVEPDEANHQVRLIIWDKGIGIKAEHLPKLFQPFTQVDSSLAREYAGTGLGLSLVKRLVELHHGTVTVESVFGAGSRFTVTLPWTPQHSRPLSQLPETDFEAQPETLLESPSSKLILITDDNALLLDMLADFLEAQNYRTAKVHSGKEFLEKVAKIQPDLILMDIQMPGMDGLEALRHLRKHQDDTIAAIPVIAVTALAMTGDRERCLAAGANEYISKPVKLTQLQELISQVLEDKSA